MNKDKSLFLTYLFLHIIIVLYSISGIFSKFAALAGFPRLMFFAFFFVSIIIMGIYAILWQQILKRMSLSIAYASKAATIIWGMLWGFLFFGERISIGKIIGGILVIFGVVLFSLSDNENNE